MFNENPLNGPVSACKIFADKLLENSGECNRVGGEFGECSFAGVEPFFAFSCYRSAFSHENPLFTMVYKAFAATLGAKAALSAPSKISGIEMLNDKEVLM